MNEVLSKQLQVNPSTTSQTGALNTTLFTPCFAPINAPTTKLFVQLFPPSMKILKNENPIHFLHASSHWYKDNRRRRRTSHTKSIHRLPLYISNPLKRKRNNCFSSISLRILSKSLQSSFTSRIRSIIAWSFSSWKYFFTLEYSSFKYWHRAWLEGSSLFSSTGWLIDSVKANQLTCDKEREPKAAKFRCNADHTTMIRSIPSFYTCVVLQQPITFSVMRTESSKNKIYSIKQLADSHRKQHGVRNALAFQIHFIALLPHRLHSTLFFFISLCCIQ